ncbi:sensor histidine kinase-like protein/response regulator [Cucurbitaria berberidis CBS 394.84]|uniref:histidine kinase n=1 Tax=Cucurbitaria berberidis CBS 394.84 TaxID=1168544 RepID=A0A9P4GGA3_9PLEO|nr:sensor histidine kinase-like protein/response regulator [Cucurbitaria berberidis CBS 394.84]KAF1844721.1 sensor histidine kinase-like protein/response regulator [Cucurbitaria berberidis CBS 394.84]
MPLPYLEAARERDLHRYYRPWLDAQTLLDAAGGSKSLTYAGYRPQTSKDRSLTAFAQLAALRLDARRAMVSLIDSHRQYILAEATRTLSLFSPTAELPEDQVWLGNAILNKADAICFHTFKSTYTAKEDNGETLTAECMVVPDCRSDPRFSDKDYVKSEPGIRFYAGVPIITRAGHRIGVYAVSDERPRESISAADLRFMQDVASAVMEHLELAKNSLDRSKGERMVRGLTQFIEHSSSQDIREDSGVRPTTMERQTENARLETLEDGENPAVTVLEAANRQALRKRDAESDTARIFQRAARIMRQSTEADGVVFFDTSTASIKVHLHDASREAASSDENNTTDFDTGDSTTTSRRKKKQDTNFAEGANDHSTTNSKPCPVAGLSLREGNAALVHTDFAFTDTAMERYIHRYPHGKFFNYNEEGVGVNSSDEKSERSETDQSDHTLSATTTTSGARKQKKKREKFIPTEFLRVLPNVRTLIFLPLWDPASERWVAGGFIWTTQAGRLMSPENELPYLQAFGNSITSEVARLSAQKADRAKTTFIASISHELRSPLHGILGSVEFLRETVASAYQESLVSSIEICGKTLLDTIDHVLDYAKINKLRSAASRRKNRVEGRSRKLPADNSILGVTAEFDLAQLVEEVCDTVCTGHTFRKTHNISGSAIYDQAESVDANSTKGDMNHATIEAGRDTHGSVAVSLIVEPDVSWIVRSQPGALRRIVMNLLGNALKYTDSGFIAIKMLQSSSTPGSIDLSLTVEDSGRGMSGEYQRTKLFSPFSQEDPFSSGTGLGLSIVKQIVESLKGEIDVRSTVHIGTAIKISMRLPTVRNDNAQDHDLLRAPKTLKGATVSIIGEPDTRGGARGVKTKESMFNACQGFKMKISKDSDADASIAGVDFLLTDSPSLDQLTLKPSANRVNKLPLSVVCICTDTAERTAIENRLGRQIEALGWIAEIVAQPCGPRKLARALLQCQKRASQDNSERPLSRSMSTFVVQQHRPLAVPNTLVQRSLSDAFPQDLSKQTMISSGVQDSPLPRPFPSIITPTSPLRTERGEYFNPRVLLVDDNAINLKLLVVFAKRQSLRYAEATNGLEALETYKREAQATSTPTRPFDFVLMDLSMPIMDGLTSTHQIRQFETKNGLPKSHIVALTGLASGQDQKDAYEAGVDTYLVKPVKFADIKRIFGGK